jgi:asparagine synthase (glutamine-hydrolysing)
MMAAMHHRGPDGEGHPLSGAVGLSHGRLSIICLEYGAQPIAHEDESVWVVLNGSDLHFMEAPQELHRPASNSEAGGCVEMARSYWNTDP